jgi:hypothetical protein
MFLVVLVIVTPYFWLQEPPEDRFHPALASIGDSYAERA